ncbi:MAG: hypothetical protein BWY50_01882 [Spirochaetes bacterium ADurb.Bin315]|nr:MAG: hypothetical protein BWY50_01882 [Spirochaetes bacterium ADurb.Bin315]
MERVVPWKELNAIIEPFYPKAGKGRPPVGVERMLRIHFLQSWFNLSDPAAQEALRRGIERGKGVNRIVCAAALELPTGEIATGCNSPLLHASSALILNAVKILAGIDHEVDLIPPAIVQSVTAMKRDVLKGRGVSLNLDETLICLAMSRAINEDARKASEELPRLMGCEVHMTHIPSSGDSSGLRKLLLNVTSDPRFPTSNLYNPA